MPTTSERFIRQCIDSYKKSDDLHLREISIRLEETLAFRNVDGEPYSEQQTIAACARVLHRHLGVYAEPYSSKPQQGSIKSLKYALCKLLDLDEKKYQDNDKYDAKLRMQLNGEMRKQEFSILPSNKRLKLINRTIQQVMEHYYTIIHTPNMPKRDMALEEAASIITHLENYYNVDELGLIVDPTLQDIINTHKQAEEDEYLDIYKRFKRTLDACCDNPKISVFRNFFTGLPVINQLTSRWGFDAELYNLLQAVSYTEGFTYLHALRDAYFKDDEPKHNPKRHVNYLLSELGNAIPCIHANDIPALTKSQKFHGLVNPAIKTFNKLSHRVDYPYSLDIKNEDDENIDSIQVEVKKRKDKTHAEYQRELKKKIIIGVATVLTLIIACSAAAFAASGFGIVAFAALAFACTYTINVVFYLQELIDTFTFFIVDFDELRNLSRGQHIKIALSMILGVFYAVAVSMMGFVPLKNMFSFCHKVGSFIIAGLITIGAVICDSSIMYATLKGLIVEKFGKNILKFFNKAYDTDFSQKSKLDILKFFSIKLLSATFKLVAIAGLATIAVFTAIAWSSTLWITIPACTALGLVAAAIAMRDVTVLLALAFAATIACGIITFGVFVSGLTFLPPAIMLTIVVGASVLEFIFNIKVMTKSALLIKDVGDYLANKFDSWCKKIKNKLTGKTTPSENKANVNPAQTAEAIASGAVTGIGVAMVVGNAIANAKPAVPSYKSYHWLSRLSVAAAKLLAFFSYGAGSFSPCIIPAVQGFKDRLPEHANPKHDEDIVSLKEKNTHQATANEILVTLPKPQKSHAPSMQQAQVFSFTRDTRPQQSYSPRAYNSSTVGSTRTPMSYPINLGGYQTHILGTPPSPHNADRPVPTGNRYRWFNRAPAQDNTVGYVSENEDQLRYSSQGSPR